MLNKPYAIWLMTDSASPPERRKKKKRNIANLLDHIVLAVDGYRTDWKRTRYASRGRITMPRCARGRESKECRPAMVKKGHHRSSVAEFFSDKQSLILWADANG